MRPILGVSDFANLIGISPQAVRRHARAGTFGGAATRAASGEWRIDAEPAKQAFNQNRDLTHAPDAVLQTSNRRARLARLEPRMAELSALVLSQSHTRADVDETLEGYVDLASKLEGQPLLDSFELGELEELVSLATTLLTERSLARCDQTRSTRSEQP